MPRVTYVKRAQVRYPTVPTLDGNGQPIVTPVLRKDGSPRLTKAGRAISRRATHDDRTAGPLPNHVCGRCGKEIMPGEPYKWIAPRTGPYGGRKMYRCGPCPTWQPWDYSQAMNARLAQVSYDFASLVDSAECEDDVQGGLDEAAEQVRELAEEKRDSAQNIEDGFGHPTSMSEELADAADQLDSWADEIEAASIPELPEEIENSDEDTREGLLMTWREEVASALDLVDQPPV